MAISRMQQPQQIQRGLGSLQDPRQNYGLGKLVKKAVRGVKKIVKSPIGKMALTAGLMGAPFGGGSWFGAGSGWGKLSGLMGGLSKSKTGGGLWNAIRGGAGKAWGWAQKNPGQAGFLGLGAAATALPFLMGKEDEEEEVQESWTDVPSSIANIRNQARNYYTNPDASTLAFMPNKQFVDSNWYAADGGRAHRQGFFEGALADTAEGQAMSPGTSASGGTHEGGYGRDDVPLGGGQGTVILDTVNETIPEPVIKEGYNWKNIFPGGKPFYGSKSLNYENVFGTQYDPITGLPVEDDEKNKADAVIKPTSGYESLAGDLGNQRVTEYEAADIWNDPALKAQGGRVGLLNGGEAGEAQLQQMLMAEFVKYKNQGGTLTFEQFVQAVMQAQEQQPEGAGMEQPQEVAMAANGGRIDTPKRGIVDGPGSYAGFRLLNENKRRPPNKFDFLYTTGPLNDDQKDTLQNMTEEDWEEADKGGFVDIIIDILKTPYIIRGGDPYDWFNKRDGGRIGAYKGGLMSEDEDEYAYNPQAAMRMYRRPGKQEGGIMETEVAEEMIDLGGKEKDYRETGGFVDLGGKERADDVPARLSKNEFVFTADAVRAAGGGDIDAGSEVMQNMMDNLEQGGEISEESQGLEGAQAMYDQQQMLQSRIA